jgi:uncharacterized membrane protein YgaE (UPF0421/DUF939 family)
MNKLEPITPEILEDMLRLISSKKPPQTKWWSQSQRNQAEKWARSEILRASDNSYVRRVPVPDVLQHWYK